jgi:MarR family transcriptional regulator, organic hydroperoxide resistance regulator
VIDAPPRRRRVDEPDSFAASASPETVLQQFRVVFTAIKTHFQQLERQAGIGGAQVWALATIRDHPRISIGELAVALSVRQPTASNLARSLAEHGCITHQRRTDDRRGVALRITRAGRALLARVSPPYEGVLPAALGKLDPDTLQRLDVDLRELISHLNADDSARLRPLASL